MSRQVAELVIPANTFDLRVMTTHLEFFSEIQSLLKFNVSVKYMKKHLANL
ncbi:MAG: hypothetical protein CM1200mP30_12570 [Pseudomonadota bacterium]|nr:MAG: hypothetical protein CM1200mP30_12570 [Pseudomonadota bacterium]